MLKAFMTVNWPAILLAAAAAWVFGAAWYTSLGKVWMTAMGKTMEQCQAEQAAKSAAAKYAPFVVVFIAEVIMAWALYGILVHMNSFTVRAGLISAALIWFGFVFTTIVVNNAFAGRSAKLSAIDAGGWLGAMLLMGAIVGWMGR